MMNINQILYSAVMDGTPESSLDITQADLEAADIVQISDDTLHIIIGHTSRLIKVVHADYAAKQFELQINGRNVSVKLRDAVESRIHAMGFDETRNHKKLKQISSPMPGLVLKVLTKVGESVTEGQPLIVLEAMKMENVLNAPTDGVVNRIHVRERENVDKGQVLVELD